MNVEAIQAALRAEDVEALGAGLGSERAVVRQAACESLVGLGTTEALEVLYRGLSHTDPEFRVQVVRGLGSGRDPFAVARLGQALRDSDPYVRIEALDALATLGSGKAFESLVGLLEDESPAIRRRAVRALARYGGRSCQLLARRGLEDADARVRRTVVDILCDAPDAEARHLAGRQDDAEHGERIAARLRAMTDPEAIADALPALGAGIGATLVGHLDLETVVRLSADGVESAAARLAGVDADERRAATHLLLVASDEAGMRAAARTILAFDGVLALLEEATGPARPIATRLLLETGHPAAFETLLRDLESSDAADRRAALEIALDVEPAGLALILQKMAADRDPSIRALAIDRLAAGDDDLSLFLLQSAAFDDDPAVAARAVRALVEKGVAADELDEAFARVLLHESTPAATRIAIAARLGRPGATVGTGPLGALTDGDDAAVRRAAGQALARMATAISRDALADRTPTSDRALLATIALALDEAGDERALVPLLRLAEEGKGGPAREARQRTADDPRLDDVHHLLVLLATPFASVQKAAALRLAGIDDRRIIRPLLEAVDEAPSTVQPVLLQALARFLDDEAVVLRIVAFVDEGDLTVRQEAVRILGEGRVVAAVGRLTACLANVFLRPYATEALKAIGERRGLLAIKRRQLRDGEIVRQMERIASRQRNDGGPVPVHPILRRARRKRG